MSGFLRFISKNAGFIQSTFVRHIWLVAVSVLIGLLIAVPLGIALSRRKKAAPVVLAMISLIQTIPGLVLLGFAMIVFGIGVKSAIIVLALYAILPMLRNTYTGITEVDPSYTEAARGIGMTDMQMLFKVELPLALPSIIGGLRLSTVYIISWATLAGLIGAGGLGDLIWTGLSTYEKNFILAGALPAALLAIIFGGIISFVKEKLTPPGLREKPRIEL